MGYFTHATGPSGLSYAGEPPPNPDAPLVVSMENGLTFELRVLQDRAPTRAIETTVCDSISDAPFQTSKLLLTRRVTPLRSCLQAPGVFSQPYIVEVRLNESFNNSSAALTERKIMVVLGSNCSTIGIRSGIFNVIGLCNGGWHMGCGQTRTKLQAKGGSFYEEPGRFSSN